MRAQKEIRYYVTPRGKSPFLKWIKGLEGRSRIAVGRLIQRVAQGGSRKSVKSLGHGVWEIKMTSGLRMYFGQERSVIILLLMGGNKTTQVRDIEKAKQYWRTYGEHKNELWRTYGEQRFE